MTYRGCDASHGARTRPITEEAYEEVVTHARDAGLERLTLDRPMLADQSGPLGLF